MKTGGWFANILKKRSWKARKPISLKTKLPWAWNVTSMVMTVVFDSATSGVWSSWCRWTTRTGGHCFGSWLTPSTATCSVSAPWCLTSRSPLTAKVRFFFCVFCMQLKLLCLPVFHLPMLRIPVVYLPIPYVFRDGESVSNDWLLGEGKDCYGQLLQTLQVPRILREIPA